MEKSRPLSKWLILSQSASTGSRVSLVACWNAEAYYVVLSSGVSTLMYSPPNSTGRLSNQLNGVVWGRRSLRNPPLLCILPTIDAGGRGWASAHMTLQRSSKEAFTID